MLGKHGVSKWQVRPHPYDIKVSITKDGKEFAGEYYTQRGMVCVRYGGRAKGYSDWREPRIIDRPRALEGAGGKQIERSWRG